MYFHDKDEKEVENNLDTIMNTVGKINVPVSDNITLEVSNPVYEYSTVLEVVPNMNIPRIDKEQYEMQLYYNLVKGMSRRKTLENTMRKDGLYYIFHYGIDCKKVCVTGNQISIINSIEYPVLNNLLAYIVAQLLYENIEDKPFTLELDIEQERQLKKLKYYLSRCYHNTWHLVREYLLCNEKKITNRFRNLGFVNLRQVEMKMKRN